MGFFFFLQPFSDSNVGPASNNEFQLPRTVKRPRQSFCYCKKQEIIKTTTSLVLYCTPTFVGADGRI